MDRSTHELKTYKKADKKVYLRVYENVDESFTPINYNWELVDIDEGIIAKSEKFFIDKEICVDNAILKNDLK